ncbi:MAG: PVC-type heme-binding CxxCH protein [Verrucomicrobiota bacterium]
MLRFFTCSFLFFWLVNSGIGAGFDAPDADSNALPSAPEGFAVELFAREPLVSNPCALAFDSRGRLFVGMGPQWRAPRPDSMKDSIFIIEDRDGDGVAESRSLFATGFNSVQSIAWRGRDLWVANSPDLTVVRDLDGDDIADEYIKVFTDLGNIEHCLHGLNWAPDGRLYMSKGNSKGISLDGDDPKEPGRVAPKAFRELFGFPGPAGASDLPPPQVYTRENYRATYQDPRDDWGQTGGILRYDPDKPTLEIYARGFRNPWDIAFDSQFNWLGTDNDQVGGDRIFMPFRHAHFGWGHPWSPTWPGKDHLPTAPNSGQIIEGSYTGIVFANTPHFPKSHRDVWFIGDWMTRKIYLYRPEWDGALNVPMNGAYEDFVVGGNSLFRPTDIAMGRDGSLWILGWGRNYGGIVENGQQTNEGRIYRVAARDRPLVKLARPEGSVEDWSFGALLSDLGSWVPTWQIDARDELVRRGKASIDHLQHALRQPANPTQETWATWTLATVSPKAVAGFDRSENVRLQLARAGLVDRSLLLQDSDPRLRLAAIESAQSRDREALVELLANESDPVVFHAAWRTVMTFSHESQVRELTFDPRSGVRRAGVLMRMESLLATESEVIPFLHDEDPEIQILAAHWLSKVKGIDAKGLEVRPYTPDAYPLAQDIQAKSGLGYRVGTMRIGEPYYIDRDYRIRGFPDFLSGASMILTSNQDDGSSGDDFLRFETPLDVSVYVAHDERVQIKPNWLGEFGDSDSVLVADDGTYRLFVKDFPAGKIELGGNTHDGKPGGKGNYVVVLKARPPATTAPITTMEMAVDALKKADAQRGEALFHASGGAGCATCHVVGGRGSVFGPDLSAAGEQFHARHLLESMLNPSAVITEGFAMQNVHLKDGSSQGGVIREESQLVLTLAQPGGGLVRIDRKEIERQESLPASMMPPYSALLDAQALADLTAYLLTQKQGFAIHQHSDSLEIRLDQKPIATYLLDHPELTRRAFVNVRTPSGLPVTRRFPPRNPEDLDPGYRGEAGIIHPIMHPGLWMSFGWIDGNDYWRLQSKVKFEGLLEEPLVSRDEAQFKTRDRYLNKEGTETVCWQDTTYRFRRVPEGIRLDWDATFYNDERDFTFGDQEESGLALRIASPLRVQGGNGRIVNDSGEENGAGTWGKPFQWINYSGEIEGKRVGLMVLPHPENLRPSWSHSRDYGVLASNPFPKQPKERREPYMLTRVKKGEPLRLRYQVLIHESDPSAFDPEVLAHEAKKEWK